MPPEGNQVGLNFSGAYAPPEGNQVGLEFSPSTHVPGDTLHVFPSGLDAAVVGSNSIRNAFEFLAPGGINALQAGQPTIWNLNQRTLAGGIVSRLTFGETRVENRNRYVAPSGFGAARYGTAALQGGVRLVLVSGIAPPALTQKPWASYSPRWLAPEGLEAPKLPVPVVGGTRWLAPEGFEATRWGTRVTPEPQVIYPDGQVLSLWGGALLWNYTTRAAPQAIKWASEDHRFGAPHIRNWQRYVTQYHDAEHVDAFGIWTGIENRNRVITHHSTAPGALPSPAVENGARALLPVAIEPPADPEYYKAGMVAYRVREFPIDGIEAPAPSHWLTVANGARVLDQSGFDAQGHGQASLENTRRNFPYITGGDQQAMGAPMVSYAIREITFESRYGIEPPSVPLPGVKLNTRYIEPPGYETYGTGGHYLQIHWTIVTPRWTHTERFGYPEARNVTPELRAYGHNSEEFGAGQVRTQWRELVTRELYSERFGLATIADRRQVVQVGGTNALRVGDKLSVQNTLPDLPGPQWIVQHSAHGYNITATEVTPVPLQDHGVGTPIAGAQSIRPAGIEADDFELLGIPVVQYMGINDATVGPEDGIGFPTRPWVSLKVRTVAIVTTPDATGGIPPANDYGKPVISPHTIYAVTEATAQAVANHPVNHGRRLHFVDCSPVTGEWLKGVGAPGVSLLNRTVIPYHTYPGGNPSGAMSTYGTAYIRNKHIIVRPAAIKAPPMAAPKLAGFSRTMTVSNQDGEHEFGPEIGVPWISLGTRTMQAHGIPSRVAFGVPYADFYHRSLAPSGIYSMAMGSSGSTPRFMRQRLHVGAPDWPEMQGFDAQLFGAGWISNRVRGVEPEGFSGTAIAHEFEAFHLRMRVTTEPTPGPAARTIGPTGIGSLVAGVGNISNWVQYIRPDGNMDNYRKGAPT